jgi:hypothetical protein
MVIFLSVVAVFAIISRSIAQNLDRQRIREYVEKGGNEVLEIVWKRFGKGWLGSNQRIYDVTFKTRQGKTLTPHAKPTCLGECGGLAKRRRQTPKRLQREASKHCEPSAELPVLDDKARIRERRMKRVGEAMIRMV